MARPLSTLGEVASSSGLAGATAVFLGSVFSWSGIAKLMRPYETAMALVGFRVTSRPRIAAGRTVASGEVILAGTLVGSAAVGGVVGQALLAAALVVSIGMCVLVSAALRRGQAFACMCFGAVDREISTMTLLRGVALVAVAGLGFGAGFLEPSGLPGRELVLWVVISSSALALSALASRMPMLARFPDPFDFTHLTALEPTGFGPIVHDHPSSLE